MFMTCFQPSAPSPLGCTTKLTLPRCPALAYSDIARLDNSLCQETRSEPFEKIHDQSSLGQRLAPACHGSKSSPGHISSPTRPSKRVSPDCGEQRDILPVTTDRVMIPGQFLHTKNHAKRPVKLVSPSLMREAGPIGSIMCTTDSSIRCLRPRHDQKVRGPSNEYLIGVNCPWRLGKCYLQKVMAPSTNGSPPFSTERILSFQDRSSPYNVLEHAGRTP